MTVNPIPPGPLTAPTTDEIVAQIRAAVPDVPVDADTDLVGAGLDSLRIMRLAGGWRKAGFDVSFAELLAAPTPEGWQEVLAAAAPGDGTPGSAGQPAGAPGSAGQAPVDPDAHEPFPLAPLQHAYWAGGAQETLGGVSAHLYVELDGPDTDPEALAGAVDRLLRRHGMLRAEILDDGTQRIAAEPPADVLHVDDLRDLSDGAREQVLEETRRRTGTQRLAADHGRMIDIRLSRLPGGRARLHVDFDMLGGDAMSYRVALDDLAAFLDGDDPAPVRTSFREYVLDPQVAEPQHRERDRAWWRDRLDDLPVPPRLPVRGTGGTGGSGATPTPPAADHPPAVRRHLTLDPAEKDALRRHAAANGVTPAAALAAAFAEAVGLCADSPRFLLNLPLFHRQPVHDDVDRLVGDFSSLILVEVDLTCPAAVLDRVRALSASMRDAAGHADWNALDVLRDLGRRDGGQVIAPVVYTSAVGLGELFSPRVRRRFGDPVWIISQGPQVLLDAQVTELDGGFLVNWDIQEHRFRPGVVDTMFDAYRANVRALTASADWSAAFPGGVPAGQLAARDRTHTTAPVSGRMLHEGFFDTAAADPGRPAVLWGEDGVRTYGEVADAARRVAGAVRAAGAGRGDVVGVRLRKGPDQVPVLLGVLAAGAAWVPLGVDQPVERLRRILGTADCTLVLADGEGGPLEVEGVRVLDVADAFAHDPVPEAARAPEVDPEDLAYVLFTSGSTGEPKGVEVPHRAVMNTLDVVNGITGMTSADRTLALASVEFDLSVQDVFGPLSVGGAVVCLDADERRDPEVWARRIDHRGVTHLYCVPPLLDMLLAGRSASSLTGLRWCLLGGDRVTTDLPGRLWARAPRCRVAGLGGATETAIHETFHEVTGPDAIDPEWQAVPFGTPLPTMRCRVVDAAGRDRPDHVPGELWVAGPGLADGYRHDPGKTADRFPVVDGVRWYRTGDRVRYLPGGCIEFLGRADDQLKIRGYRVETGEVEAALRAVPGVAAGAVSVYRDPGVHLGAVVQPEPGTGVDADAVARSMARAVPPYMVPDRIVTVAALPVTANGKIDRRACARIVADGGVGGVGGAGAAGPPGTGGTGVPGAAGGAGGGAAAGGTACPGVDRLPTPGTLEHLVAGVLEEVLDLDPGTVGADDDVIALGGDSVLMVKVVSVLRELLDDTTLPAAVLFENRTARTVAEGLRRCERQPGLFDRTAGILHELDGELDDGLAGEPAGEPADGRGEEGL
ncbi:amino acid adenylation domain-containing protein [Corynebacterium bovis]|nr:amino acid adenylation domain-containing protein [Corynebacterium bovis]